MQDSGLKLSSNLVAVPTMHNHLSILLNSVDQVILCSCSCWDFHWCGSLLKVTSQTF